MPFLAGKRLLITGVLSNRSIAYGIAKACRAQGAELAFSYVGDRLRVLSPGRAYPNFLTNGLTGGVPLPAPDTIHTPLGNAPGGRQNKVRHNQWRRLGPPSMVMIGSSGAHCANSRCQLVTSGLGHTKSTRRNCP